MQRPLPLLKMWYLSPGSFTNFQSDHHCVSAELSKSPCRMTTPSFNRSVFTTSPGTSSIRLLFTLTMWYQTVVSMFIGATSKKSWSELLTTDRQRIRHLGHSVTEPRY